MKVIQQSILFILLISFFNSTSIYPQWYRQTIPTGINILSSISFAGLHGIAGGRYAIIYTNDGGSNWLNSSVPSNNWNYWNVQMINDSIGYAAGNNYSNNGVFLKTTDGGASWISFGALPEWVIDVYNLFFINESIGFITVDSSWVAHGGLLKTTDGGLTWNKKLMFSNNMNLNQIVFGNSSTGFVYGDGMTKILMKTTDQGETWQLNYSITDGGLHDICSGDDQNYYFVTETFSGNPLSRAYRTTNAGSTWSEMTVSPYYYLGKVRFFPGSGSGLIMGKSFGTSLFRSTDGGTSWSDPIQCPFYIVGGVSMVSDIKWFVTTYGSIGDPSIYMTSNGGTPVELTSFTADFVSGFVKLKWSTETELNNKGFEIERAFHNKQQFTKLGYIPGNGTTTDEHTYSFTDKITETGKYYYRLKQIDFNGKTEYSKIIEVNAAKSMNFSLEQNYPNPFNPSTTIKYSVPIAGNVNIKIYSILGKELKELVNENKDPGTYSITFDASSLPSGIYFYKIHSSSYSDVKKMTLLR